jgi:hypothetical protein
MTYRGLKDVVRTMITDIVNNFYTVQLNPSNNLNPIILKNQVINLQTLFIKILSVIPGRNFANRLGHYPIGQG